MAERLDAAAPGFAERFAAKLADRRATDSRAAAEAAEIVAAVRARGDSALRAYAARLDRADPDAGLRVAPEEIARARAALDAETAAALELAAERIAAFHRGQVPRDRWRRDSAGVGLGERWRPIAAVGLYVPGGRAAYPSSVLMNAVPARVAGGRAPRHGDSDSGRSREPGGPRRRRHRRGRRDMARRRRPGHRRAGLRDREHRPGGQDRRPRQRLGDGGQAAGLRNRRHRRPGRAVRGPRGGGRRQRPALDCRRPSRPGRARPGGAIDPDDRRPGFRRRGRGGGRGAAGGAAPRRGRPGQLARSRPGRRPPRARRRAGAHRPRGARAPANRDRRPGGDLARRPPRRRGVPRPP